MAIALTQQLPDSFVVANRLALCGVPGAVIVMATLSLERRYGRHLAGWPERVGDASYAIDLVHGFVVPVIGIAIQKLRLGDYIPGVVLVALLCGASLVAGVLTHLYFEKPIKRWLSSLPRRRAAVPA